MKDVGIIEPYAVVGWSAFMNDWLGADGRILDGFDMTNADIASFNGLNTLTTAMEKHCEYVYPTPKRTSTQPYKYSDFICGSL